MDTNSLQLTHHFSSPIERVFRAFTSADDLQRWAWGSMGKDLIADVDLRSGGAYRISTLRPDGARWAMHGTFTDVVPNKRLAYILRWDSPMDYDCSNESVAVDFAEDASGTIVTFSHFGVPSEEARKGHAEGWGDCFRSLEGALENNKRA